eukprot:Hpha_TRINITY_DN15999_c1_g1::TRINITY_DN15999_c1_g1_i12::g.71302::m.71302
MPPTARRQPQKSRGVSPRPTPRLSPPRCSTPQPDGNETGLENYATPDVSAVAASVIGRSAISVRTGATRGGFLTRYMNAALFRHCSGEENLADVRVMQVALPQGEKLVRLEALDLLPSLEVLTVRGQRIQRMEGLASIPNLKRLNLSGNLLSAVEGLQGLSRLEVLDLSANAIRRIPAGLAETCPQLRELLLPRNDIDSVREVDALRRLQRLEVLDLSQNSVVELPQFRSYTVWALPAVQTLCGEEVREAERLDAGARWQRQELAEKERQLSAAQQQKAEGESRCAMLAAEVETLKGQKKGIEGQLEAARQMQRELEKELDSAEIGLERERTAKGVYWRDLLSLRLEFETLLIEMDCVDLPFALSESAREQLYRVQCATSSETAPRAESDELRRIKDQLDRLERLRADSAGAEQPTERSEACAQTDGQPHWHHEAEMETEALGQRLEELRTEHTEWERRWSALATVLDLPEVLVPQEAAARMRELQLAAQSANDMLAETEAQMAELRRELETERERAVWHKAVLSDVATAMQLPADVDPQRLVALAAEQAGSVGVQVESLRTELHAAEARVQRNSAARDAARAELVRVQELQHRGKVFFDEQLDMWRIRYAHKEYSLASAAARASEAGDAEAQAMLRADEAESRLREVLAEREETTDTTRVLEGDVRRGESKCAELRRSLGDATAAAKEEATRRELAEAETAELRLLSRKAREQAEEEAQRLREALETAQQTVSATAARGAALSAEASRVQDTADEAESEARSLRQQLAVAQAQLAELNALLAAAGEREADVEMEQAAAIRRALLHIATAAGAPPNLSLDVEAFAEFIASQVPSAPASRTIDMPGVSPARRHSCTSGSGADATEQTESLRVALREAQLLAEEADAQMMLARQESARADAQAAEWRHRAEQLAGRLENASYTDEATAASRKLEDQLRSQTELRTQAEALTRVSAATVSDLQAELEQAQERIIATRAAQAAAEERLLEVEAESTQLRQGSVESDAQREALEAEARARLDEAERKAATNERAAATASGLRAELAKALDEAASLRATEALAKSRLQAAAAEIAALRDAAGRAESAEEAARARVEEAGRVSGKWEEDVAAARAAQAASEARLRELEAESTQLRVESEAQREVIESEARVRVDEAMRKAAGREEALVMAQASLRTEAETAARTVCDLRAELAYALEEAALQRDAGAVANSRWDTVAAETAALREAVAKAEAAEEAARARVEEAVGRATKSEEEVAALKEVQAGVEARLAATEARCRYAEAECAELRAKAGQDWRLDSAAGACDSSREELEVCVRSLDSVSRDGVAGARGGTRRHDSFGADRRRAEVEQELERAMRRRGDSARREVSDLAYFNLRQHGVNCKPQTVRQPLAPRLCGGLGG